MLKEIYLDPNAPQGNRIKAAQAALPHETPRLNPVPPPLELTAEPIEPLADVVRRQRARVERMIAEEETQGRRDSRGFYLESNGNGQDDYVIGPVRKANETPPDASLRCGSRPALRF